MEVDSRRRRRRQNSSSSSSSGSDNDNHSPGYEQRKAQARHAAKRRKLVDPTEIETRLESLILRVGEKSSSSLESNLEGLASVLEADLQTLRSQILRIFANCVVKFPEKLTVYTTLVGLLNAKTYTFGGEFVELLCKQLRESLRTSKFQDACFIVRFLADLVNCRVVVPMSLLNLFDNFTEIALETNIPQVRADWYVYAVLSSLPWVGRALYLKKTGELDRLLGTIDNFIRRRHKVHLPAIKVWESDVPHVQEEYLDCLWAQIQKMRQDKWHEKAIYRPYAAFDSVLSGSLQHNMPQIIPPTHNDEMNYPQPTVIFRMFDYTDVPEGPILPGSHSIERFLIEESIDRIICANYLERKDCATALLQHQTKNKVPLNYMIVEVAFAHLFALPLPPYPEVFYGSLFIELCKLKPENMPQVLAQAVELLFDRVDSMNLTCLDRFACWFSYHLSNFQFRWSWEDWVSCVQQDPMMPKPRFITEVLHKCLRLSYHQRIVDIVSDSFASLLPPKSTPIYKYQMEGANSLPGTAFAHQLAASLKAKCTPEEALMILQDLPNPLLEEDGVQPTYNPLKIDVFVSTLLYLGSKSFSHSIAALSKFNSVFKMLADTEDAQIHVLRTMCEVWMRKPQMMTVLVDKMLKTQVIGCAAVANWIFSEQLSQDFTRMWVWEIMHGTILKMNKHVKRMRTEVREARHKYERWRKKGADKSDSESDQDDDIPTEEMIDHMADRLEQAQSEQKNLFLIIFQRFIILLTDHLSKCEAKGVNPNTMWYKWCVGRLLQVFLLHHHQVYKYIDTLEELLFTSDIDVNILSVFQQFCALRS